MRTSLFAAASAALFLGGCNTTDANSLSPDPAFGEAIKYDMAIQIIDPDPVYDDEGAQPGESGVKGAEAVKRYRTDKVKDAKAVTTSTTTGGAAPK